MGAKLEFTACAFLMVMTAKPEKEHQKRGNSVQLKMVKQVLVYSCKLKSTVFSLLKRGFGSNRI